MIVIVRVYNPNAKFWDEIYAYELKK